MCLAYYCEPCPLGSDSLNSITEAAGQAFALVAAADPKLVDIVLLSLRISLPPW